MSNWVFLCFWLALGIGVMFLTLAWLEIGFLRRWFFKAKVDEQVVRRFVPD